MADDTRLVRAVAASALGLVLPLALLSACGEDQAETPSGSANPYVDGPGYADPNSRTAEAAEQATVGSQEERVFTRLAETPQGIWLTPEQYPPGEVGPFVTEIATAAEKAGEVPTFVVYGIPNRDCSGGFSGGGLPAGQYVPWVQEIADAAAAGSEVDSNAAFVVEPDALATSLECDEQDQRLSLISDAVDALADAGVTAYVDGGHSNWIEPADIADLLEQVGVDQVRGFATNVANYQTDQDEQNYAEQVSSLVEGAHYVIDNGRNGNGSTEEWCNPSGRSLGTAPAATTDQGDQDAFLWVKPPGESDGECNGGPVAGQFWPERALELTLASGW